MPTAPSPTQPWRLGPRGRRWFDLAVVGFLLLPVLTFPVAGVPLSWTLFGFGEVVPLLWRRRRPVLVFAVVATVTALQVPVLSEPIWSQLAFPVALYSVARFSTPVAGLAALATGLVGAVVGTLDWLGSFGAPATGSSFSGWFVPTAGFVVTAWALGTLARTRQAFVEALVERGERIAREAEQQVELAASAERARIAREMHDVVAHGLTVMVVQADGARYASEHDPRLATETLERIAGTGREALADMRQLLGLLRSDDPSGRAPLPGLRDLPALVAASPRTTADLAGLDADGVPTAVALTTYRVVQEALTNVRKHAGPAAVAHVRVERDGTLLRVRVTDDGRGAAAPDDGRGHGLAGMRERVDVHGGTLAAGPLPGGGYGVEATIPW